MARTIEAAFAEAKRQRRAALIPYVTAGYPALSDLPAIIAALSDAGADLIEIGIPFSDPLADGPVLQRASTAALAQGVKIRQILEVVATLSAAAPPIVFLTYVNPVYRWGLDVFARAAGEAGVQGLIIPDLPWSEGGSMREAAAAAGLSVIPLVAPTSHAEHLAAIRDATGFVYGVSVTGVTGARQSLDAGVRQLVERVKAVVNLPVAVGFGISTPEQAAEVGRWADGVIVGSALVQAMAEPAGAAASEAFRFVSRLRRAL